MSALATTMTVGPATAPIGSDESIGLRDVERRMLDLVSNVEDMAAPVADAARRHLRSGGRRTRAAIALAAGERLGLAASDRIAIAAACELLHNASLVHDDLQDRAPLRRGQPAVWTVTGDEIAICAGDLLLSAAYGSVASCSPAHVGRLLHVMHARVGRVIGGQAGDLAARQSPPDDFRRYRQIAAAKSSPLLALPLELVLIVSGFAEDAALARLASEDLAVAYQVADDLQDIEEDAGGLARPPALNAVDVLRRAGFEQPVTAAAFFGLASLRHAMLAADQLPYDSGEALVDCIDAVCAVLERYVA